MFLVLTFRVGHDESLGVIMDHPHRKASMKKLLLISILFPLLLSAAPYGSPDAKKGGSITVSMGGYPKALMYYLASDTSSAMIAEMVLEPLLESDPTTFDIVPRLAESWKISKDKKTFTFKLNKAAQFADGKPLTTKDVKFTWDTLMNPKHNTVPFQSFFSDVESCTVVDEQTVEFKTKNVHFQNLEKLGGIFILPEHAFAGKDFNKLGMATYVGSGPYRFGEADSGKKITLERNEKYWGAKLPQNTGRYNFDRIIYKVVPDNHVQLEIFKRGDTDLMLITMAKMWVEELKGELFEKNWATKYRMNTKTPSSMAGIQWNMRRPLFKDKKVRLALGQLMNREQWIKDLFYNEYIATSGLTPPNSEYHPPKLTPVKYNPTSAKKLLAEAGWKETDSDGVLKKGKERFEFEILMTESPLTRAMTLYQEDLRKMGIKMSLRTVDWATLLKLSDEWGFDAFMVGWTRSVNPSDFTQMWGSIEADQKGSQNKSGYKNPEVDKLSRKIDQSFDKKARVKMVQALDAMVSEDQPMSYFWEMNTMRIIYWNKFGMPKEKTPPYSDWHTPVQYWWAEPSKADALKKAVSEKKQLDS